LVVVFAAGSAGCAHVKRDELNTELDTLATQLRKEQADGDAALAGRISAVETQVNDLDQRQAATERRMEQLEQSLRELETEVGVTIERLEGAIAFSVPLYFEFDSSTIEDSQTGALDRFAGVYDEFYDGKLLTVEGFTDEAGSEAYNQRLGMRRAEEVKSYLTEVAGLDVEQVRAVSYGESSERLVAPGEYGPSRGRENRRVVLVIDTAEAAPMTTTTTTGSGGSGR
jgi:peptidoglycan-associated lipoprotein